MGDPSALEVLDDAGRDAGRRSREYGDIVANPHHDAFLGRADGRPAFLVETYDPHRSALADLPELEPGDLGMHVLIGPPEGEPLPGYTRQVFAAVLEHCFADPTVRRIVVEPDVGNAAIRAKNIDAGFVELREVPLPGKTAMLSVCTREAYKGPPDVGPAPDAGVHGPGAPAPGGQSDPGVRPRAADRAGPRCHPAGLVDADGGASYSFSARVHPLEHWVVDPSSIDPAPDAQVFIAQLAPVLGIPDQLLPTYLEEIGSTLAAAAWKLRFCRIPVRRSSTRTTRRSRRR